jgi:hypothetical protein
LVPTPGTGDLLVNPNFVNPGQGNFALNTGSQCIGAGQFGYDIGAVSYAARPKVPTNLQISNTYPSLNVQLTWTNPTQNSNGTPLASITAVKIYRNDQLIATLTGQTPGGAGQYNDVVPVQENYRYRVLAATSIDGLYGFTREMWIGPSITALPTGPDTYGYHAYDRTDAPEWPLYQWVEISADSGGLGTALPFATDDSVFTYALPFTFNYYGTAYDSLSIGANGWVAPGTVIGDDYSNSAIPSADGPERMIAAYWEDLSPQRTNSGRVWTWFDATNHRYIVEWNHVEQWAPLGSFETFQVIIYDPVYYPTSTGDTRIKVQYKDMSAAVQNEGTIGIENPAETDGLQYKFDGTYDSHAVSVINHSAIIYTTPTGTPQVDVTLTPINPPILIPAQGGNFSFTAQVANTGSSPAAFDAWIMQFTPQSQWQGPMLGPINLTVPGGITVSRLRNQNVPGAAPAGVYTYRGYVGVYTTSTKWDSSSFQYTKSTTADGGQPVNNWANFGESFAPYENVKASSLQPSAFSVKSIKPNPFNPATAISFELRVASYTSLKVFDISGRLVATLVDGWQETGIHEVIFDGSGLSSGQYFARLQAGSDVAVQKMVLVK